MKVFELANKLGRSSKEILQAAEYLEILVKTKSSILSDEEVKQIIKYFSYVNGTKKFEGKNLFSF